MPDATASAEVLNKLLKPLGVSVTDGQIVEVAFRDGTVTVQATTSDG